MLWSSVPELDSVGVRLELGPGMNPALVDIEEVQDAFERRRPVGLTSDCEDIARFKNGASVRTLLVKSGEELAGLGKEEGLSVDDARTNGDVPVL